MNSFFAVSLDIDNQREHIIYCSDSIEAFYTNQTDNVFKIERPLGEFIFDFSGLQEQERYNAVTEYLSNFPEHNSAHILTEIFFEAQRHLSFLPLKNDKNRFCTYDVLKICSPETICKTEYDLRAFYVEDKLYIATEYDVVSLFRYYLDELYAAHLFPHKCNSCCGLFLSDKMRGGYICLNCRKQRNYEKLCRYKDNHDDKYEAQYMKVYQKWYTRIRRAKERGQMSKDKLQICNKIFSKFTSESYKKRCDVRNGKITPDAFLEWLDNYNNQMNTLFPLGNRKDKQYGTVKNRSSRQ